MPNLYSNSGKSQYGSSIAPKTTMSVEGKCLSLPTTKLVSERRYDLAVKSLYFRHLYGGEFDERNIMFLYEWHIATRNAGRLLNDLPCDVVKRSLNDYHRHSTSLRNNMARYGFDRKQPIPIDRNGELMGGAHRLACAIALHIKEVPVVQSDQEVWQPAWGRDHFEDLPSIDLIDQEFNRIRGHG